MDYEDTSGRALTDYPRPSVAVDVALLTVAPHTGLSVLLIKREGRHLHDAWQLPGTFLHEGETLADAAARALRVKVGVDGFDPLQLEVLDAPGRDDRGWVLSVAHLDVVPFDRLDVLIRDGIRLEPVRAVQGLAFDHDRIVELAVGQLRREYAHVPDPRLLLGEEFTLLELQRLHEAVAGEALPKDTFRRSMQAQLTDLGRTQPGVVGKPARLFGRR
ncbi:MAG TPA: NUDIX domain-containing protein [Tessaracoccus flavescens]|uniref:NUDIX domain-containing protein n=1 Tax=Tessaracoccus flavescens TaxID=399497 RepID=A0A921JPV8_9ACTN|nr:NUDIX domain-containing protein [Tessaracoccus flavescens]